MSDTPINKVKSIKPIESTVSVVEIQRGDT